MATINERLNILANTTDTVDAGNITLQEIEEQKKKNTFVDFKMVAFSLAGKDYAIDIMKVKERAKAGFFTYVPNTLPFVLGVYNLRGEIIPIIDLRLFFNIDVPAHVDSELENMLIVTVGEQTFGVVVDSIDKVVGIQKSSIQPPHPLFGDINIKYISGVVEADRRLYVLLDIEKIFGLRTPEEEKELADNAQKQLKLRQAAAIEIAEQQISVPESSSSAAPVVDVVKKNAVDLNFIADSLKNFKKFTLNSVTEDWAHARYNDWASERGDENTQLQSEDDAEAFLKPFFSECTSTWWTESYAEKVRAALPDNTAKNIIVWNPGCGKGFESYSLACILKKKYPDAKVRIYAHDIDLLSVSNAPLMNLTDEASRDWYQPFISTTVTGEYTFSKEIKDMVMFEYHDCVNTNNLPPIDIVFARDVIAFLPEASQNTILNEFDEKMKGNGVIIVGENENISIKGWSKKQAGSLAVYSKQ